MLAAATEFRHLQSYLGPKMQLGYVVADMDAALRFWVDAFDVGPFIVLEEPLGDRRFIHRGRQSDVKMSVACSYFADVQVEFISQSNDAPSTYREFLSGGRAGGLHHIGFWPQDYAQACMKLERHGFTEVTSIEMPDGTRNASYFEGPAHLGAMVEVVPSTPARASYFASIRAAAASWDGTRPIRRYANRAEFLASTDCKA
jgi:hypothetical protein